MNYEFADYDAGNGGSLAHMLGASGCAQHPAEPRGPLGKLNLGKGSAGDMCTTLSPTASSSPRIFSENLTNRRKPATPQEAYTNASAACMAAADAVICLLVMLMSSHINPAAKALLIGAQQSLMAAVHGFFAVMHRVMPDFIDESARDFKETSAMESEVNEEESMMPEVAMAVSCIKMIEITEVTVACAPVMAHCYNIRPLTSAWAPAAITGRRMPALLTASRGAKMIRGKDVAPALMPFVAHPNRLLPSPITGMRMPALMRPTVDKMIRAKDVVTVPVAVVAFHNLPTSLLLFLTGPSKHLMFDIPTLVSIILEPLEYPAAPERRLGGLLLASACASTALCPTPAIEQGVAMLEASIDDAELVWEVEDVLDWASQGLPFFSLRAIDFSLPGLPFFQLVAIDWSQRGVPEEVEEAEELGPMDWAAPGLPFLAAGP